jgi:hypothetical protein
MTTETDTVGDEQEVECPWCGESICLQDPYIEGTLEAGWKSECEHCGKTFEVKAADYEITVYLRRGPTSGATP